MKEYQPGQKKKKNSLTLQSNISQCVLVLFHLFYLFIGFSKIVNVFFKPASKKKGGKESYRGLNKKSTWSGEMLSG